MNAHDRGKEEGFAVSLTYIRITKEQFERVARHHASHAYGRPQKQDEYFSGFMENWREPHAQDCTCTECASDPEILTY